MRDQRERYDAQEYGAPGTQQRIDCISRPLNRKIRECMLDGFTVPSSKAARLADRPQLDPRISKPKADTKPRKIRDPDLTIKPETTQNS
jgi:hypothetical protein